MSRPGREGFTLLEAVVALVIVGLTATAVLTAVGAELRGAARAQRGLEAAALAEYRLGTLQLREPAALYPLADSLARGRFAPPFEEYRWSATVRPVRGELALFDLAIRVEWEGGTYPLHTRLYRPLPMPRAR